MASRYKFSSGSLKNNDFSKYVRKRPGMFIGNDGIIGVFVSLIIDCIEICKTDKIEVKIIIFSDNIFSIEFASKINLNLFLEEYSLDENKNSIFFPKVLKTISKTFEIIEVTKSRMKINLSFDEQIITKTNIDYLKLTEKLTQLALLNRQCEIITIDKRQKYINQNYFHFPQGIFYLFNRITEDVLGKPNFKLIFDDTKTTNKYQIGLAYRSDWFPTPKIMSYANDEYTICGGSLVDGILDGLINACKVYVKENNLISLKIEKKKFLNGLIIVCAVRGENYKFEGSFKETLKDNIVKKQAKKIIEELVLDFLKNNKEKADDFLWRFDSSKLTSGMF